ncbi:hypothetical protein EVAR_17404_1 [Eumeta japonica]|uniref:Uncharacterized protein n=1 Tax=Eumeta variegata TaxID=151549 RepID=A0A4C1V9Y3_EUMVA|nr:hypothetical protein EVAR_17404_1 [Eumeta japonica]
MILKFYFPGSHRFASLVKALPLLSRQSDKRTNSDQRGPVLKRGCLSPANLVGGPGAASGGPARGGVGGLFVE